MKRSLLTIGLLLIPFSASAAPLCSSSFVSKTGVLLRLVLISEGLCTGVNPSLIGE